MAQQTINIGTAPNDGTGTPLRTSFDYCNLNFTELYTALGGGTGLPGATTQVIFNDGGTNLAGDAGLVYNKTTDALTIGGNVQAASATISGDLTVDTSTLKVVSASDTVGIRTATPNDVLEVVGSGANGLRISRSGLPGQYTTFSAGATGQTIDAAAVIGVITFGIGGSEQMRLNSTGLGVGVTPSVNGLGTVVQNRYSQWVSDGSTARFWLASNWNYNSGDKYIANGFASSYTQQSGQHIWLNAPSGTAGNAITFTQAMTLDASGNLLVGGTSGSFRGTFVVAGGADRDILIAGVTSVSGGFQVKWNNSTSKINVIIENIPTSSAGLATGTLWNDAGTIKIA